MTYVDITIGFGLDLHFEECKSTFKLVQRLLDANTLAYEDIPSSFEYDLHLEECKFTFNLVQIFTKVTYIDLYRLTNWFWVGFAFRRMQIHFENGSNTYRSYLH